MQKKLGFSLIELTVTIAIASILAAVGISGYMQTLMISRRKEATIGLQRAMLILSNNATNATTPASATCPYPDGTNITMDNSSTNCLTGNGLYYLNYKDYNDGGFDDTINDNRVINNLISKQVNGIEIGEKVIFKATAVATKSQSKDTDCLAIYLTNMNNLYPVNCVK